MWLQHHLYNPDHVYWYDALCTLIYTSHFLVTPVLAAVLWIRNRALWLRYITRVIVLSVAGLITYVLFPEAPPWLAARDGLTEPVARLSARGWIWLHASNVHSALATAQNDGSNPVAAMPSLHTAFATLVALFIGLQLRSRWRWLLVLYPAGDGLHARLPRRALRGRPRRRRRLRAGGAPGGQPVGAAPGRQGPAEGGGPAGIVPVRARAGRPAGRAPALTTHPVGGARTRENGRWSGTNVANVADDSRVAPGAHGF